MIILIWFRFSNPAYNPQNLKNTKQNTIYFFFPLYVETSIWLWFAQQLKVEESVHGLDYDRSNNILKNKTTTPCVTYWSNSMLTLILLLLCEFSISKADILLKVIQHYIHETLDNKRGATLICSFLSSRVFCSIVLLHHFIHNIYLYRYFMQWNFLHT